MKFIKWNINYCCFDFGLILENWVNIGQDFYMYMYIVNCIVLNYFDLQICVFFNMVCLVVVFWDSLCFIFFLQRDVEIFL